MYVTNILQINIIIVGDLNAKTTNLGCKNTNQNGLLLEELIIETNLMVVNNKDPTYYRIHDYGSDMLDWCLKTNNLHANITSFEVLNNNIDSDHISFQVVLKFSFQQKKIL